MFNVFRKEMIWGGRKLVLETGKMARQADAAVVATYGETTVLATVTADKSAKPGVDFFPLTVHYQEKAYAAGKIPGGFFKREGRPSEKETLVSRLIDRPIRPLFVDGFRNETLVIAQVLSHDLENDPDIVAMVAASAALTLSGIPFMGPVGAARIGMIGGKPVLNPTLEQQAKSALDLVVAGTQEGVLMVESEAKELSEDQMLGAVMEGWRGFQPVIDLIVELAEMAAKDPWPMPEPAYDKPGLLGRMRDAFAADLRQAYQEVKKQDRHALVGAVKKRAKQTLVPEFGDQPVGECFKELEAEVVRLAILDTGRRIDGRDTKTVRPIVCEVGVLPRVHGSALFTRGETQALVITTLGFPQDEQIVDALEGEYRSHFMLHYNFPPYSVGETGRFGAPGRREIGHGKLAWRALNPLLPGKDTFPTTIRVVSEITESNGSSSMASVCGASLAMMDANVPLPAPVAGIAMGLIKEGDRFAVLSDILGDEDHLGDMDFKVAGTARGVTSLQMDLKITSITEEIMRIALDQAKDGRIHILGEMGKALSAPRGTAPKNAPKILVMTIAKEKIRDVIGTGGKVIREIQDKTGAKIDIEDDGTVKVGALDERAAEKAVEWIRGIVQEPEIGQVYLGKVVKVVEFGAFVNFLGSRDGLVHISELATHRVGKVTDIVKEGDEVRVKCIGMDDRGKVKLSMKAVLLDEGAGGGGGGGDRERERGDRNERDRGDRDRSASSRVS